MFPDVRVKPYRSSQPTPCIRSIPSILTLGLV